MFQFLLITYCLSVSISSQLAEIFEGKVHSNIFLHSSPTDPEETVIGMDWRSSDHISYWFQLSGKLIKSHLDEKKEILSTMSVKHDWETAPELHKIYFSDHTAYGLLTEGQQFFYVKHALGLEHFFRDLTSAPITQEKLEELVSDHKAIQILRSHIFDGQWFYLSPATVWWYSHIPADQMISEERSFLQKFGGTNEFVQWPIVKSKTSLDYLENFASSRNIDKSLVQKEDLTVVQSKWIFARKFQELTSAQKEWFISKTAWGKLTEEQQFWSMLNMFQLDTSWTKSDVIDQITNNLVDIQAQVAKKWVTGDEEGPEQILWISMLLDINRTPDQRQMLAAFSNNHFHNWPLKRTWAFSEYNEEGKTRLLDRSLEAHVLPSEEKLDWIRKRPFEQSSLVLRDWVLKTLMWGQLSDEFKFESFKIHYHLQLPSLKLEEFKIAASTSLPLFRNAFDAQLEETPEFLFWVQIIAKELRTNNEQAFFNAYGYGFFDNWPTTVGSKFGFRRSTPVTWESRTLQRKAIKLNFHEDALEQKIWYYVFRLEILDTFGEKEYEKVIGSFPNIEPWMISYYRYRYGYLTEKQKLWGLKHLSELQSPEGKEAFQDMTLQTAMEFKKNKLIGQIV